MNKTELSSPIIYFFMLYFIINVLNKNTLTEVRLSGFVHWLGNMEKLPVQYPGIIVNHPVFPDYPVLFP